MTGSLLFLTRSPICSRVIGEYWPLILLVLAAVAYHVEYALNFVFVGYVSSVAFRFGTYAHTYIYT